MRMPRVQCAVAPRFGFHVGLSRLKDVLRHTFPTLRRRTSWNVERGCRACPWPGHAKEGGRPSADTCSDPSSGSAFFGACFILCCKVYPWGCFSFSTSSQFAASLDRRLLGSPKTKAPRLVSPAAALSCTDSNPLPTGAESPEKA